MQVTQFPKSYCMHHGKIILHIESPSQAYNVLFKIRYEDDCQVVKEIN